MGVGNIIENNIKTSTHKLWQQVPTLKEQQWLDFDLKDYHKPIVNLAVIVGIVVAAKTTIAMTKCALSSLTTSHKVPTSKVLHDTYGYHSWALIADCRGCEDYAHFLAKNGFNLILMGEELDIQIVREKVEFLEEKVKVETMVVDWKR